ncbi:MAG: RepB family plasmid replication initiator protein, partial [Candidatus Electrothrix sp. AX5]|nr:RepB family plasmid replication initiator protein [Candidatus Electrothrix sp. AX5]
SYTVTVVEQKIILAMVSMIHPDDADFFSYEMKLKDLADFLNINVKYAYHEIDNITRCLRKRELHIPEKNGWINTGWVSSCRYNGAKGTVSFRFDPELKPYLVQLKNEFTKYRIALVVQFKSIYSIRIYQLLKQYKGIGYRKFRVDKLKEILGIKQNEYREFKRFRGRVLNQAKKEFEKKDENGNFKCDLTFELETIREERKIARLKFVILPQKCRKPVVSLDEVAQRKKKEPESKEQPQTVKEQLVYYGISEKLAVVFLNQMQEADILDILRYYSDLLKVGKVKNTGGAYLAKLLREGVTIKSSYDKDKEAEEELRKKQREFERKQKELEELARKKAEADQRNKKLRLEEQFDSLPEAEQEQLLLEFEKTLDKLMLEFYRKAGVQSVVVRA